MRLRLRTKITFFIALLVLGVVGASSYLYLAQLTSQVIQHVEQLADVITNQVYEQARNTVAEAPNDPDGPRLKSNSPDDLREYIRQTLERPAFTRAIDSDVADSPLVYEVTIVDSDGMALVSSDHKLIGQRAPQRPAFAEFTSASFMRQLRTIYGPPQVYQVEYSFNVGDPGQEPFGEIRVALQTTLLRNAIDPALRSAAILALGLVLASVFLAALVSSLAMSPLASITAQLEGISKGEFDSKPVQSSDEFGQVSTKISQVGQQLRGVREIFGTLRENMDQLLAGLEDGLILFTHDGRAGMVSPAVEKFLGVPAAQLLGKKVGEVFPPGHPLRDAIQIQGDELETSSMEMVLTGRAGETMGGRIVVSVQVITEGNARMGALVTLRDLESIERIDRVLQVSERMSAMSRVTTGVAHEVKNPLNNMRLWLENLKESLSPTEAVPRQAVAVLDSEIKRLDSVVKRFLDFMRAPELHLEETDLSQLLAEVAQFAKPQLDAARVQLRMNCATVPPIHLDRGLLKQALLNLVYNGIEAMPGGGTLTMALEKTAETVEISISDTGLGIKPEHRARIFQLFFTTRPGGSGIGLASAYKTVQLHEGSIDFESEPGSGTTFHIELPLVRRFQAGEFERSRESTQVAASKAS